MATAAGSWMAVGTAGEEYGKVVLNDKMPALVKPTLDTRIRYEYGDQEGLDVSHAGTMRNRVGLLSREMGGFQIFGEYEGTLAVDRNSYRAASVHGPAGKTIIADPESHELNQAWVSYTAPSDVWGVKVGRQRIILDNWRWVGNVGWRQNEQTYDAAGITFNPTKDIEVYYGFIWQVNRIFGSDVFFPPHTDFTGNSHIFNTKFKNTPLGTLTTYVYSLDLHNLAGDINSNTSFGFSLAGPLCDTGMDYYLEYAHQIDAYSNPIDYEANYVHASVSGNLTETVKGTLGMEYLGSSSGRGFAFPLGTNHKFNGFADRFLATPAGGLTDWYASVATPIPFGAKFVAAYHYFWDDGYDVALGQEVDLVASKDLGNGLSILAKAAFFDGMGGQPDVTRASLELDFKY